MHARSTTESGNHFFCLPANDFKILQFSKEAEVILLIIDARWLPFYCPYLLSPEYAKNWCFLANRSVDTFLACLRNPHIHAFPKTQPISEIVVPHFSVRLTNTLRMHMLMHMYKHMLMASLFPLPVQKNRMCSAGMSSASGLFRLHRQMRWLRELVLDEMGWSKADGATTKYI